MKEDHEAVLKTLEDLHEVQDIKEMKLNSYCLWAPESHCVSVSGTGGLEQYKIEASVWSVVDIENLRPSVSTGSWDYIVHGAENTQRPHLNLQCSRVHAPYSQSRDSCGEAWKELQGTGYLRCITKASWPPTVDSNNSSIMGVFGYLYKLAYKPCYSIFLS